MSARSRRRVSLTALVILASLTVAGCLQPAKAKVSVADMSALFPAIERLGVRSYMVRGPMTDQPGCEFFLYRRGPFTSATSGDDCRIMWVDPENPDAGPVGPAPSAFDREAQDDLAALKREFGRIGVPIEYLYINLDSAGSVGPRSAFAADRCVAYFYEPGWTALPEDIPGEQVSTGITADWYKTDTCP